MLFTKTFVIMIYMSTYAERLVYAMEYRKIDQTYLAKKVGVRPQAIQYLCKRGKRSTNTAKIARALEISDAWLEDGIGEMEIPILNPSTVSLMPSSVFIGGPSDSLSGLSDAVRLEIESLGKVPLISWVSAGSWCEAIDNYSAGDAEEWLPCPVKCSAHTYALKISGDSMTSMIPGAKTYPEGCVIYVDPEAQPTNGRRVVAKLIDKNEVTFKTYKEDAGEKWLMPINPQYNKILITDNVVICGVVIAKYEVE